MVFENVVYLAYLIKTYLIKIIVCIKYVLGRLLSQ